MSKSAKVVTKAVRYEVQHTSKRIDTSSLLDQLPMHEPPTQDVEWEPFASNFVGAHPLRHVVSWRRKFILT